MTKFSDDVVKSLYIDAVQRVLAEHIDQRLASSGCRLTRGTTLNAASYITRRWPVEGVVAFHTLAKANDYVPKGKLASGSGWKTSALDPFWSRLRQVSVPVVQSDGAEVKMRLFRRGREMVFASRGIFLKLNVGPLAFDLARTATETTIGAKISFDENYQGAANAQEADETRSQEERQHANRTLAERTEERTIVGPQTEMFKKASGA